MSDLNGKPELNNEHRFMALLALTSQQLPEIRVSNDFTGGDMKQGTSGTASFERLDADPAALESFLRRHAAQSSAARGESQRMSPLHRLLSTFADVFAPRAVRYAAAASVTVLAALLLSQTAQWSKAPDVRAQIERSYAAARFDAQRSTLNELVLPWERPPSAAGFAPGAANESTANIQFAQGLLVGRQRLAAMMGATERTSALRSVGDTVYESLGEWNVLLWAIGESGQAQSPQFWREQIQISDAFAALKHDDDASVSIDSHLASVKRTLTALESGQNPVRNARLLADELLLFREQFAPHRPLTP